MNTLPHLTDEEIELASTNELAFAQLLNSRYEQLMQIQPVTDFSIHQHAIMAYLIFAGEVNTGGFIQLIQNRYGAYIFDNPFSSIYAEWGIDSLRNVIDTARPIYQENKTYLERETSLQEFTKMYEDFTEFEELDELFREQQDTILQQIVAFIQQNAILFYNRAAIF